MTLTNSDIGLIIAVMMVVVLIAWLVGKEQGRAQAKVIEKRSTDGHWTVDSYSEYRDSTSATFRMTLPREATDIALKDGRLVVEIRAHSYNGKKSIADLAKEHGIVDYAQPEPKA